MEDEHIKTWTKEEKFFLLEAIQKFTSKDITNIKARIPTKEEKDIKKAIEYYQSKASSNPQKATNKRKAQNKLNNRKVPLAMWAKLLRSSLSDEDRRTEIATAFRLIATFDDIPASSCTNDIDFRKAYHALADSIEGKPLPEDKKIVALFDNCIKDAALIAKAFMKQSDLLHLLNNINLSDSEINVFPKPTDNHDLAALRELASHKAYNPLNIPEHFLKLDSNK